jgi:carboxylesterase
MGKKAIVFVHGYMGCSKQFEPLMKTLRMQSATDMYSVVLPGHEASVDTFVDKNLSDWQGAVDQALNTLRMEYEDIILVGHSMGGLLLINSTIKCSNKIRAIFAISLPLYIKVTLNGIKIRVGSMSKTTTDKYTQAAKKMCGVSGITLLNSYRLIPNTFGLMKLMKNTREVLPLLSVPLTLINSVKDEIVSLRTLRYAKAACPEATLITLCEASHFWHSNQEIDRITECIKSVCSEC